MSRLSFPFALSLSKGCFVGIVFLGVGARSTRTVYVTRRTR